MAGGTDHFCIVLTEKEVFGVEYKWRITKAEMTLKEKLCVVVCVS